MARDNYNEVKGKNIYSKNKKKKKKETATQKVQSPSVSSQRTVDPKEARRQESARNVRTTASRFANENRRTAGQNQKTYGNTEGRTQTIDLPQKTPHERAEDRARGQRVKSGIQTAEDERKIRERNEHRVEVAKNTGRASVKGAKDTLTGYGKTLADVDEMAKSNEKWTEAKAMKLGVDRNDRKKMDEIEKERQESIKQSREFRMDLQRKQEERQAKFDEQTKDANELEKALYGAAESGTGMLIDTGIGAVTGTGQIGALASMGLRTYGTTRGQAEKEGATENEDRLYSLAQAGKEMGTELMFQGAGLAKGYAVSKSGKAVGLSLADKAANALTKGLTGKKADIVSAGVKVLGGTGEENIEELAGWMADPVLKEAIYGRNVRQRTAESLRANLPEVTSKEDADRVAAYFSTDKFETDLTQDYINSGLSKKEASELAQEMRDYYVAYYSNDEETLNALEDDLSQKLSGQQKLSKSSWSSDELIDTFASTTLLTLGTGLPGGITSSVKGNQMFDSEDSFLRQRFGDNAVKLVTDAVKNTSDAEMSAKAQAMEKRLSEGKDLTGTQKYELAQGYMAKVRETSKKAEASNGVVVKESRKNDYVATQGINQNGERVFAKETQKAFDKEYESASKTVDDLKGSISETDMDRADAVKKAVADLHVGGLTVGDAHEFGYGNELARETLKRELGIDLDQYVVKTKDGKIDYAATNDATENALFELNAQNAIDMAKVETDVYIDDMKGEIDTDLLSRFGSNAQTVWKDVNQDLDPHRDLKGYLATADAVSFFVSAGRNTDLSVDEIMNRYANVGMNKSVDDSILRQAIEAGRQDRIDANTPGNGQTVEAGQKIALKKTEKITTGELIIEEGLVIPDSDQQVYKALADATNANIHLVSSLTATEDGMQINGMSKGNDIYLNLNASAEENLGYVFMHEMTHQIKQYAPNEYLALENLVRDRWFNKDQKSMDKMIKDRIALYSAKADQSLSEEEALEEIIADAMAEAMDDPNFAAEVCEQNPDLAEQIISAIRSALRSIRQMFAGAKTNGTRFHNGLLSYLGILDDAERMWLDALAVAKQNKANGLIADWQARANRYSLGYHAGDLGKSTADDYAHQGYGRGTGHFGFGTYFVGDKAQIGEGTGYGNRPVETVDFDKYNLFKPEDAEQGWKLHEALKLIDGFVKRYSEFADIDGLSDEGIATIINNTTGINRAIENLVDEYDMNDFEWNDEAKRYKTKVDKYINESLDEDDREDIERKARQRYEDAQNRSVDVNAIREELSSDYATYKDWTDFFGRPYINEETEDEYINNNLEDTIRRREESKKIPYDYYYYTEAQDVIKGESDRWDWMLRNLNHLDRDLDRALGYKRSISEIRQALKNTEEIVKGYGEGPSINAEPGLDSAATVFMKQLGYEGVDVRHIKELDNTGYGSVIYDLKGEDLARKQEIGTARYSVPSTADYKIGETLGDEPIGVHAETEGENSITVRYSIPTEINAYIKGDGRETSVRLLRNGFMKGRGKERKAVNAFLDALGDHMTRSNDLYKYLSLSDVQNATVTYRKDADGNPTSVIMSCQVQNGEYEINYDFSTICKKRKAFQDIIEDLFRQTDLDTLDLTEENIFKINRILEEYGFEIACPICFVEARRYANKEYADKIVNTWNAEVEKVNPDAEYFDFANSDPSTFDYVAIDEALKNAKITDKMDFADKCRVLVNSGAVFQKKMQQSDILTDKGITGMKAMSNKQKNLFGYMKGSRGASAPKEIVAFNAYNGEIENLNETYKGMPLADFLYTIGGARLQSFSDFQIENVYDYIQLIAGMAARKLPAHAYTKEVAFARLFGMTGMKINLSLVCDVDPNVDDEHAGLTKNEKGEWVYNLGSQSFKMEDAEALQSDPRYSKNVGTIMVGLSDAHIWMSLDDERVRYIIPYHKSGLPGVIQDFTHLAKAEDYTKYQNTCQLSVNGIKKLKAAGYETDIKALYEKNGKSVKKTMKALNDMLHAVDYTSGDVRKATKLVQKQGGKTGEMVEKELSSTGDFNVYDDVAKTKNPRKTAENYISYCFENGYMPLFFEFAGHKNYYKMIFDFNVYDSVTGKYAPQGAVKNIYPGVDLTKGQTDYSSLFNENGWQEGEENGLIDEYLHERDVFHEKQDAKMPDVISEIKSNVLTDLQEREEPETRWSTSESAKELDAEYMDAVNSGDMDKAQKLVDKAAEMAGMRVAHRWHGSMNADFTKFSKRKANVEGNSGAGFYFTTNEDDAINHYKDSEGADNYFKVQSFADYLMEFEAEWNGVEIDSDETAKRIATEELNKNPGVFDVYLNYKNPYVRDSYKSTNIFAHIDGQFDDSLIDRDDYDTEDDYDDAWREAWGDHIYEAVDEAVRWAYDYLEENYDYVELPDIAKLVGGIAEYGFNQETITWDSILSEVNLGEVTLENDDRIGDEVQWGATELTRAIIEGFGYDAIQDKEVDTKFGQLSREMMTGTEHIIVFRPEQIKLSDPVTYAEDGSVIPLSERFDPNNDDIRYSMPTQDSEGRILSDGQMEFFKNSQARDEQGRLVPVYHTTNKGGFTIFDPMKSDDHRSLFFADDWDTSQTYGNYANSRFYYFDIDNIDDVKKYLDAYSPDRYFVTQEQFDQAGGWEADMLDFENVTNGEQSDFAKYLDNPDGYIAIIGVPDYSPDNTSYADTWVMAKSPNELVRELHNHFGWQRDNYRMGTQHGYYACYLNLEDPYIIDAHGDNWNEIHLDDYDDDVTFNTREIAEMAMDMDFDGVIIRNLVDHGGKSPYDGMFDYSDIYIAFSSNQVKDINNENPTENPDIRYSIPDRQEALDTMIAKADSIDIIPLSDTKLEEQRVKYSLSVKDFENMVISGWDEHYRTYGRLLDDESVKPHLISMMSQIMKDSETGRKYKSETLDETIKDMKVMYFEMKNGMSKEFADRAWAAAERIVNDVDYNDDLYVEYKGMRDYLEKRWIQIPEALMYDEDFAEYMRDNSGRMRFGENGSGVEAVYKYLRKKYPKIFTEDLDDPVDMLLQMDYVLDLTSPYRDAYTSEEYTDLVKNVAESLCEMVRQGEEYRSVADDLYEKFDARSKAMKQRHREALDKVRSEEKAKRQRQSDRANKWKEKYQQRIQHDKEVREAKKEKKMHRALYDAVLSEYNDLTKRLLKPSKDKKKNIPEQLRQPLAEMLYCFDLEKERSKELEEMYRIPTRTQLNFRQMKDSLEKVIQEEETAYEFSDIHKFLKGKMTEIADKMDMLGDHSIDALDNNDIAVIKDLMVGLNKAIKDYQQFEIDGEKYEAQQITDKVGEGAKEHESLYGKNKKYEGLRGFLDNIVNMGELTPIYFFKQIKGMYDMYRQIRKGFDSYVRNEKDISDKITKILAPYYKTNKKGKRVQGSEIEEWRHLESAETFNTTYGSLTLTIAQRMSLYCLYKRDQARNHMLSDRGGVVASEITAGSKMHKAQEMLKGKVIEYKQTPLTPEDVENIITTLTPEQMKIADELQELMSNDMSKLGNQASVKLTGIEMYKEKEYFPIKIQGESKGKDLDNIGMQEKVRNPGFSNPLQDNAQNPIILDDIFTVVASHCNEMNLYASYAVPLTSFMKVYNGSVLGEDGKPVKVQTIIKQTYGEKAIQYIDNFLDDINGNSFKRHGGLDDVLDKALGQAKKASVFANLRVALQQPTAIVRAFAVMHPKYFVGVRPSRKATQEMFEHCPIAQWKSWGYYDTHFGRDIEDVMMGANVSSKMDVIMSDIYGEFDNMTWGMIWQAVKKEVKAENPKADEGTQEFWDLCSERASYVFDMTQVVDSPFHRSNDMRSKNGLVKQLTSFQAEPTLSFNVLRQGFVDAYEEYKKGNKAKAEKALARVLAVWTTQAVTVAIAQSFVDALRRKGADDDEDPNFFALWWQNFMADFVDDINPINNVYYFKEIVPPILNALTGQYVFGQQNLTFQWVDTLTKGIQKCKKKWEKGSAYKTSWYDCLTDLFGGVGYLAGIPVKTMMRGVKNAVHWFNKITGAEVFADDGTVDKAVDGMIDRFRKEKTNAGSETASDSKSSGEESAEDIKNLSEDTLNKLDSKAEEKVKGYTGSDRDEVLWDVLSDGYTKHIEAGDMDYIYKLRVIYQKHGGNIDVFNSKVASAMPSIYKKTFKENMTEEDIRNQEEMRDFMLRYGMSETELSDICYHTDTAKDLKAALRMGNEQYILDELVPLIRAGLTREDFERLYKNRNRGANTYSGKYNDPKYTKTTGQFIWPTDGVITSHFGHRNAPTAGASSNHPAIDIGASQGTPVVASDGGVVISAGANGGYGNSVGIKHSNGMVTYYNHLYAWNVKVGDQVGQGQQIGQVGSTGISTGPHLDFKILDAEGNPVDPEQYLNKRS